MRYGALESGGTKMVCAVGDEKGNILEKVLIPTTTPDETMTAIADYFKDKGIIALGIACFGPIDLDKNSPTYGYILKTPKPNWSNTNIVGTLKDALNVPVGFDTDVNGSLLGEVTWGAARGLTDAIYITIGTGIGGGILSGGKMVHGMLHPELGHMKMTYAPGDTYKGNCPFHGNCFEGLACGPAIEKRWGKKGIELSDRDEVCLPDMVEEVYENVGTEDKEMAIIDSSHIRGIVDDKEEYMAFVDSFLKEYGLF